MGWVRGFLRELRQRVRKLVITALESRNVVKQNGQEWEVKSRDTRLTTLKIFKKTNYTNSNISKLKF